LVKSPAVTLLLLGGLLTAPGSYCADRDGEGELYGEEGVPAYRDLPGSEWQEQDFELPPYPAADDLVRIDLNTDYFPHTLLVDPGSVSVGKDDVIRYTMVIRSGSGVENTSFEGIRCTNREVREYAYGSGGQWLPMRDSEWRYVSRARQDIPRARLINDVFCPLVPGNARAQIVRKLRNYNANRFFHQQE
jgi:hypothetical protein